MSMAERNRTIKKVLEQAFGRGKVTVRGSRGTGYGWVSVKIAYAPKDRDELRELTTKVWDLFGAAKIEIGTYGTPGDMGCDYGWGSKIHLDFDQCRDIFNVGEAVSTCNGKYGTVKERDYRGGGDWYLLSLTDGTEDKYSKNDMTRSASVAA
jgi:hypothetical protein